MGAGQTSVAGDDTSCWRLLLAASLKDNTWDKLPGLSPEGNLYEQPRWSLWKLLGFPWCLAGVTRESKSVGFLPCLVYRKTSWVFSFKSGCLLGHWGLLFSLLAYRKKISVSDLSTFLFCKTFLVIGQPPAGKQSWLSDQPLCSFQKRQPVSPVLCLLSEICRVSMPRI